MMIEVDTPCKGCEERELGCHGKCRAYADYREKKEEMEALRRRNAERRSIAIDSCYRRPIHKHKVPPMKIAKERSKK